MSHKRYPLAPRPSEGIISISTPIVALLNQSIGAERFARMVTAGDFDRAGRGVKFDTNKWNITKLREEGHDIPDGVPEMDGDVTWRKIKQQWQIDVHTTVFNSTEDHEWRWWEILKRNTGDAQIRIQNVQLPELVMNHINGRSLNEVIEHPYLTDSRIKIRHAINYTATNIMNFGSPACIELKLDVPRLEIKQ